MPLPGGASDKVGNRYEYYWTIFCLLDILEGRYDSIRLEPPGDIGKGIEFYLQKNGDRSFHQVKRQNSRTSKWTVAELASAGVLSAFRDKLASGEGTCVFVSMDAAGDLRELAYRAERSKNWAEFQKEFIKVQSQSKNFENLCQSLGDGSGELAFEYLKHIRVNTIDEAFLIRTIEDRAAKHFLQARSAVNALLHLAVQSEHIELSKLEITQHLEATGINYMNGSLSVFNTGEKNRLRRYLFDLVSRLEERRGISEYVELSGQSTWITQDNAEDDVQKKVWEPEFALLESEKGEPQDFKVEQKRKLNGIHEAVEQFESFALIGDPGGGKSTTLRRLCLEAARLCLMSDGDTAIPLLLELPNWKGDVGAEDFIVESWPFESDPIALLAEGKIKLYLDGLNEMGASGPSKAEQLRKWLHGEDDNGKTSADSVKPRNVIVTCRRLDYVGPLVLKLPTVQVEILSDDQIEEFVNSYLGSSAEAFLRRIMPASEAARHDARHLLSLSRNPYLLSSLIYVFEQSPDGDLPQNAGNLFKRLVETLWLRENLRGTHNDLPIDDIQLPLAKLAFSMIDSEMPTTVSSKYALFYVGGEDILKLAQSASFLIVSGSQIQFFHQLMQEYFAAVGLAQVGVSHIRVNQRARNNDGIFGLFSSISSASKWDQVAIALCGISENPEETISRIAAIDPALAQNCLDSGVEVEGLSIVPSLLVALKDEDETVRGDAARTVGDVAKNGEAIPGLIEALKDSSRTVRRAAVEALGKIGKYAVHLLTEELARNDSSTRTNIIESLIRVGDSVVDEVLKLFVEEHTEVVVASIEVIRQLKAADALDGLIRKAKGKHETVRIAAVEALGNIQKQEALNQVLRSLREDTKDVRIAAIQSIVSLGAQETVLKHLVKIIDDDDDDIGVRVEAIEALGRLKKNKSAIPILIRLMSSSSLEIHRAAYNSLEVLRKDGNRRAAKATQYFRDLRYTKFERKRRAYSALKEEYGTKGLLYALDKRYKNRNVYREIQHELLDAPTEDSPLIAEALSFSFSERWNIRYIVWVIGMRGDKSLGQHLIPLLSNASAFVRGITVNALGELRYEPAVETIITLLSDEARIYSNSSEKVKDAANSALRKIRTPDTFKNLKLSLLKTK